MPQAVCERLVRYRGDLAVQSVRSAYCIEPRATCCRMRPVTFFLAETGVVLDVCVVLLERVWWVGVTGFQYCSVNERGTCSSTSIIPGLQQCTAFSHVCLGMVNL